MVQEVAVGLHRVGTGGDVLGQPAQPRLELIDSPADGGDRLAGRGPDGGLPGLVVAQVGQDHPGLVL